MDKESKEEKENEKAKEKEENGERWRKERKIMNGEKREGRKTKEMWIEKVAGGY